MTRLLRHEGYPREDVGAIEWRKLIPVCYREHPEVEEWNPSLQDDAEIPCKWG